MQDLLSYELLLFYNSLYKTIPTFFIIHFSLLVNFIYLYSFISSLTVVFRENSFEGMIKSGLFIRLSRSRIAWMISLLEAGGMNFTLPRTTSGIEAIQVVRSGFPIATLSVCTDQNPSDNDGATIISELAINVRSSSFSNP